MSKVGAGGSIWAAAAASGPSSAANRCGSATGHTHIHTDTRPGAVWHTFLRCPVLPSFSTRVPPALLYLFLQRQKDMHNHSSGAFHVRVPLRPAALGRRGSARPGKQAVTRPARRPADSGTSDAAGAADPRRTPAQSPIAKINPRPKHNALLTSDVTACCSRTFFTSSQVF